MLIGKDAYMAGYNLGNTTKINQVPPYPGNIQRKSHTFWHNGVKNGINDRNIFKKVWRKVYTFEVVFPTVLIVFVALSLFAVIGEVNRRGEMQEEINHISNQISLLRINQNELINK